MREPQHCAPGDRLSVMQTLIHTDRLGGGSDLVGQLGGHVNGLVGRHDAAHQAYRVCNVSCGESMGDGWLVQKMRASAAERCHIPQSDASCAEINRPVKTNSMARDLPTTSQSALVSESVQIASNS
jgi:hypothetical protein